MVHATLTDCLMSRTSTRLDHRTQLPKPREGMAALSSVDDTEHSSGTSGCRGWLPGRVAEPLPGGPCPVSTGRGAASEPPCRGVEAPQRACCPTGPPTTKSVQRLGPPRKLRGGQPKPVPPPTPPPERPWCRLDRDREHLPSGRLANANNAHRTQPTGQTPPHSPLASRDIVAEQLVGKSTL